MNLLDSHECKVMEDCNDIGIEKYEINGVRDWYHHLYLVNEKDKLNAILYCPYCGIKLK